MIRWALIGLSVLFVLLPLIIYAFLIFPNFDGVMHNVGWYKYDYNSQHYLFWFGFWTIVLFGANTARLSSKS